MSQRPELALLVESFERNGRVNQAVLSAISEADLAISDGQGGWSIGQHMGHLADRYGWLSEVSPAHKESIPSVLEGDGPNIRLTTHSLSEIGQALSIGDAAALQAVQSALDEGRAFEGSYHSHPAHFLQHILVHDAHHRGQVLSLLRKSGRPREQMEELEDITWPIWRE